MPTRKDRPAPADARRVLRDRITEFRRVPTEELRVNDRNWRVHPYAQRRAIAESLESVGIADAMLAYKSKRAKNKLTLIDGHARLEETEGKGVEWPVLILDVTDEEADLLLLTLDPMSAMAEADATLLTGLLDGVDVPGTPALTDLIQHLDTEAQELAMLELQEEGAQLGPAEMELQAFEHYDYVMLLYRNALDWQRAKEMFGLSDEGFTLRDGLTRKIGLGRVVDGRRLFELLPEAGDVPAGEPVPA